VPAIKFKKLGNVLLFLVPTIIVVGVFLYSPIILNFVNSLYQYSAFGSEKAFVGLYNYKKLFNDPVFFTAIRNNTIFMIISLVFQIGVSLVIAALLEQKTLRRFQTLFRTVYFIPSLLMVTVTGIMFQIIYNPAIGLINSTLGALGLNTSSVDLLGKESSAIWAVVAVSQWQYIGYTVMLFVVAIQNVPVELYEAAEIDGANAISQFFRITLPRIREMIIVNTLITVTGAIKVFDEVFVMTSGGPGRSTETLASMLYRAGFRHNEMGYASAIAFFVFLITTVLAAFQLRFSDFGMKGDR
jgi:raffinose/stachyose/melibiose transport system permease protein